MLPYKQFCKKPTKKLYDSFSPKAQQLLYKYSLYSIQNNIGNVGLANDIQSVMGSVTIKKGNLLKASEKYIVQQCNCTTITSLGLSKSIISKYKWADFYSHRTRIGCKNLAISKDRDVPGTIKIKSNYQNTKSVICMFGQFFPGKPSNRSKGVIFNDSKEKRLKWFSNCLDIIGSSSNISRDEVIAFPYMIGCGLAGGNWNTYKILIDNFSKKYNKVVIIYKL